MSKRCSEDTDVEIRPSKRVCNGEVGRIDRLSSLSDELLIHILSFLPIPSLSICQRLSRRFNALATDSELWKRQYYSRWVWPRARRLANVNHPTLSQSRFEYSPKVSNWLDHSHLAAEGKITNWRRQYRLRHNWSKGICRVTEIEFPRPPFPPTLVNLCAGFVLTVDSGYGLRAWKFKNPRACVARITLPGSLRDVPPSPTALAASYSQSDKRIEIVVGFQDGSFSLFNLDTGVIQLSLRSSHSGETTGAITAMASSSPYLLMVSRHKALSLYEMPNMQGSGNEQNSIDHPRLLASLKADSIVAPMSLSIRAAASEIIASIVYSFFHIGCGWSLGIQELRLSRDGQHVGSRLATTVDSQYGVQSLQSPTQSKRGRHYDHEFRADKVLTVPTEPSIQHHEPPTSISYSHPYLLTSHADNTLTMYLVVSTPGSLFVKTGKRLWGHTSSVSAVQVSDRGKAISVSARGDEIRIWELERVISSFGARKALQGEHSIQISPENKRCKKPQDLLLVSQAVDCEVSAADFTFQGIWGGMRGCVGFDDEVVLLLREKDLKTHLLECYDFT